MPENATFGDINRNPQKYIEHFYHLENWIEERENVKSFAIIPMYKHRRHHLRYDSSAFRELLKSLKFPRIPSQDDFLTKKRRHWQRYFPHKFVQWEKGKRNKWFDCCIETDGVSISFLMQRKKPAVSQRDITSQVPCDGDVVVALDPGCRLMFGGLMQRYKSDPRTTLSREQTMKNITLSSREFRNTSKEARRRRKLKRWTARVDRKSHSTLSSKKPSEFFKQKQSVYGQRKVARLYFDKYMEIHKAAYKCAAEIIMEPPPAATTNRNANSTTDTRTPTTNTRTPTTWIFLGAARVASNSPIKGYVCSPHLLLRKVFAESEKWKL